MASAAPSNWMDGSHLAIALEAADTAPAYILNWLRDD
jgi:hypothetical protein